MTKIVERWWRVFGYHIYLRVTPKEYEDTLKEVSRLVDSISKEGKPAYQAAKAALDTAYKRWGHDHELVRLDALASFLMGDNDDHL